MRAERRRDHDGTLARVSLGVWAQHAWATKFGASFMARSCLPRTRATKSQAAPRRGAACTRGLRPNRHRRADARQGQGRRGGLVLFPSWSEIFRRAQEAKDRRACRDRKAMQSTLRLRSSRGRTGAALIPPETASISRPVRSRMTISPDEVRCYSRWANVETATAGQYCLVMSSRDSSLCRMAR
jgi:hypothetical protein